MFKLQFKTICLLLSLLVITSPSSFANKWEQLFEFPKYQEVKISPNGKHLAVAMDMDGQRALAFLERKTMKYIGGAKLPGQNEVGEFYWANNERVVVKVYQREPWRKNPAYYGELFAVNIDGSMGEMIYGYRSFDKITASSGGSKFKKKERILGWAEIIDLLPEDEDHILISSTPWDIQGDRLASVYQLNIYNGKIKNKRIAGSPIPYARFLTNNDHEIKVVVGIDKQAKGQVFVRENSEWRQIPASTIGDDFTPLTFDNSGDYLYALDNAERNFTGLYKINLTTGEKQHIFTDKIVDISGVEYSSDFNSIYALRVDDGYPEYIIIDQEHFEAAIFRNLVAAFPNKKVNITSHSRDGQYFIVMVSSDVEAGKFYLFDAKNNQLSSLFSYYPKVKPSEFATTQPISFQASDGLTITGYFTQAKAADASEIAPLVLLVHGGPHSRDYWHFSPEVQYLALNGYSVLQVNFRGSEGFGKSFEQAGYQNWGTKIQQDIYEAYQWAVAQGKARSGNACIMGSSFGAYSAISSITQYQAAYKCAVANAGIYDLPLMFEEGDVPVVAYGEAYLTKTLGTDEVKLKSMSPIYHAKQISAAILLAHGEQDRRAPFEHVERLKDALDAANKPYEWFSVANESHGFFLPENQQAYMQKVLQFLDKHLMKDSAPQKAP
ncbi:alpha/beta hydrolase family protein [Colwellia sp. MEBiC06753]